MGKKEVRFQPVGIIINIAGFVLGFFMTDFLVPIINAVVSFISSGGTFPTQSIFGPVANMSGPMSLMIIGLIGVMTLLLLKKFLGFAVYVLLGLFLHGLLLSVGVPIPSILDLIAYIGGILHAKT
jgi:hypothetical protein